MKNLYLTTQDATVDIELIEDTRVIFTPKVNTTLNIKLAKEGVDSEVIVLYKLTGEENLTIETNSIHNLPNTSCNVVVRAALFDSARSSYTGKIYIAKSAFGTRSFLEDKVLLVGDKVTNESRPILEILADDVKASHGATTGRIDDEALYYVMSRGLSKEEASKLFISGFFMSQLINIDDVKVLANVKEQLAIID